LGFVGKDIFSNVLSGLVIYLTQPFAQGDWITLEHGQDGWAEEVGIFYTKLIQWDKRPLYVPNFRIIQMLVQNNSRMTNRRIRFDLHVRLQDIPKIPAIVSEIQKMMDEHAEVDNVQHRLVRWRQVGDYYASIWLSCYTHSTEEGIRLKHYIAVEQSILERAAAIIYRNGADFASSIERLRRNEGSQVPEAGLQQQREHKEGAGTPPVHSPAPASAEDAEWFMTQRQLEGDQAGENVLLRERGRVLQDSREAVLKAREDELRSRELEVERRASELSQLETGLQEREAALQEASSVASVVDNSASSPAVAAKEEQWQQ